MGKAGTRNDPAKPAHGPADWASAAAKLRTTRMFDAEWYCKRYPDVAASGVEPALHYVKYGKAMGREPGPGAALAFWREVLPALKGASDSKVLAHVMASKAGPVPGAAQRSVIRGALAWAGRGHDAERAAQARRLAELAMPAEFAHAAAIVEANLAARSGDRDAWARALGEYLAGQGAAPFALHGASGNVLDDISFPEAPRVETGPLVSIIMPAWNAEASVAYAVRSILSQTWRPIELIVIDDASTDRTPEILRELAAGDPRMIVLRNAANVGPYVSKNIGLMAARGEYVTGHDADDLALPDRIERQVRFLQTGGHRCGFIGMLRITARGGVTRLGIGMPNSMDGVTSTAFISLMIETAAMRGTFGHWDSTRFSADSELDKRLIAVMGTDVPRLHRIGMLVLDGPSGLTNDPVHGYVEGKLSPTRRAYRTAARAWHGSIDGRNCYLPFPHEPRAFDAPAAMLNLPDVVEHVLEGHRRGHRSLIDRPVDCDVCILTTLRFPGGNCSSTIDEVRFLSSHGLSVRLVHCPIDITLKRNQAYEINARFSPWADIIIPWHALGTLRCKHLIVRAPLVAISAAFSRIAPRIECEAAHFVVNNGTHGETGKVVYDPADLVAATTLPKARRCRIVPIGPMIRQQIENAVPPSLLANEDWSPTFDVSDYACPAKEAMEAPFTIGRHGRDAMEKWIEDPIALGKAYPASRHFEIFILGGAKQAAFVLKGLPANWRVAEFGTIPPKAFLSQLDVFAYFPHSERHEAFGRTIVEAMIASRPVFLPPKFEETFGDLAFYSQPHGVEAMVRALAADWQGARAWLAAVQSAAIARYASEAIAARMPDLGIASSASRDAGPLPDELIAFKRRIEAAGAIGR